LVVEYPRERKTLSIKTSHVLTAIFVAFGFLFDSLFGDEVQTAESILFLFIVLVGISTFYVLKALQDIVESIRDADDSEERQGVESVERIDETVDAHSPGGAFYD